MGGMGDLAGQNNEQIVAIAMFAYDVQNVTQSHISFRQETDVGEGFFHLGSHLYWLRTDYPSVPTAGSPAVAEW